MAQGQSLATIDKERCLGSALAIGAKIANAKFGGKGFTYWHFDANAGSGWNGSIGVDGSPIVFHRIADSYLLKMRRAALFCDVDLESLKCLLKRVSKCAPWGSSSYLIPGDNEEALAVFAELIRAKEKPRFAIGSVIVDPNGYWYRNAQGLGAPTNTLAGFSLEFPRIDIILNLNTRTYKMQRAPHNGHAVLSPTDVLKSLNKKHWLVRLTQCGGDQFLLAVGRNVETGDHRALGFHKLDSPEGGVIMLKVEGRRQCEFSLHEPIQQLSGISPASSL